MRISLRCIQNISQPLSFLSSSISPLWRCLYTTTATAQSAKTSFPNTTNNTTVRTLSSTTTTSTAASTATTTSAEPSAGSVSRNNDVVGRRGVSGDEYDVVIVGGGITGTAAFYQLAAFTDARKIGLIERRQDLSLVASHGRNNSQTIHCGDIETNYTLAKAAAVKRHADLLRNYACGLKPEQRDKCVFKMPKMALAVGEKEIELMYERYLEFRKVFPNMTFIDKKKIGEVEPRVGMLNTYRYREDNVSAVYIDNEHTGVDYFQLAKSFVDEAKQEINNRRAQSDIRLNTEVQRIEKQPNGLYHLATSNQIIKSRYVIVDACGHSLLLANRMGFGLQYSCLPVAGSFYFASFKVLNGKVYTVQNPKLPFAAVHGDPDVITDGLTRFGPTALPLPLLERYNNHTFKDFLEVLKPDTSLVSVYWDLLKVSTVRNYILRNFLFEVPFLNKHLFAKDVSRIIPTLKAENLRYATGFGGVRPQLVDKVAKKLLLGEGRIAPPDENIVFNITPSPGGTTCLGTGEADVRNICKRLNLKFNEDKFNKRLLNGPY